MEQSLKQIRLERQIQKELRAEAAMRKLLSAANATSNKPKREIFPTPAIKQFNRDMEFISHHCRNHKTYRKHTWPKLSTAYRVTCNVCGGHIGWIGSKHYLKEIGNQHNKED